MTYLPFIKMQQVARSYGLSVVSVCLPGELQKEMARFSSWQTAGHAADMEYMKRDASLFVSPERLLPDAKTILSFHLSYNPGKLNEPCPRGFGRVARYARGRDYHRVLKKLLKKVLTELEQVADCKFRWRVFTDAVPLLERAVSRESGLGFVGKNTMLIRQGFGSFFFLGEALLDVEVLEVPQLNEKGTCGTCTRCLRACPTDAFVEPYVLDARKCISYLTIEKRGAFSEWEQKALGDWVFGCDICQEVCPFNYAGLKSEARDFYEAFQNSDFIQGASIDLELILTLRTEQAFTAVFAGTPLMRAKREGLIRNACAVAANTESVSLVPALHDCALEEQSTTARLSALSALLRLRESCNTAQKSLIDKTFSLAAKDSNEVIKEFASMYSK